MVLFFGSSVCHSLSEKRAGFEPVLHPGIPPSDQPFDLLQKKTARSAAMAEANDRSGSPHEEDIDDEAASSTGTKRQLLPVVRAISLVVWFTR